MLKSLRLLRKLEPILPYMGLLIIYKSFERPHLDHGGVIYEKPFIESFSNKIKPAQYNMVLALTGANNGSSCDKLHQELRLEDLQ